MQYKALDGAMVVYKVLDGEAGLKLNSTGDLSTFAVHYSDVIHKRSKDTMK